MTVLEYMMADAKQAQRRQVELWYGKEHPTPMIVPDHHGYQPAATRGLDSYMVVHPMVADMVSRW